MSVIKYYLFIPFQLHNVHDSFLALTTDGINFIMNSQEICNVINQCHEPKEAAQRISEQVKHLMLLLNISPWVNVLPVLLQSGLLLGFIKFWLTHVLKWSVRHKKASQNRVHVSSSLEFPTED